MVMSVGLSGPTPAMFHLTTHAFFKALLFLGAGSIIIALHHEQDIWKMGGLRQRMPVTFWTFLAGTLAIAGVPPFSGFFSKDSILAQALEQSNPWLKYGFFTLGVFVTVLTAFYMFRLLFIVFYAPAKSDLASHAYESPSVMVWPLRILAVFSIIGGFIGIERIYHSHFSAAEAVPALSFGQQLIFPFTHAPWAASFGLVAAVLGFAAAYRLYFRAAQDPLPQKLGSSARVISNRFYFDELYQASVIPFHELLASIASFFDRWIIAGFIVRGTHGTTELVGRALRLLQSGNLQAYVILFALGVGLVLYLALVW